MEIPKLIEVSGDAGAIFTIAEFAAHARISVRHFYVLASRGEAPATVRIGRQRLVRKGTGDAWIAARETA